MATFDREAVKEQLKMASELTKSEEWNEKEKLIKNHVTELDKKYKVQRGDLVMFMVIQLRDEVQKIKNQSAKYLEQEQEKSSALEGEIVKLKHKTQKYDEIKMEFQKMEKINEQLSQKNSELFKELEKANREIKENKEMVETIGKDVENEMKGNKVELEKLGNEMKEVERNQNQTYAQVTKQSWASKKAVDMEFGRCMNSVIMKYDKTKAEIQEETCSSLKQKLVDLLSLEKVVPSDSSKGAKVITKNQLKENIEVQKLPSPKQKESKYSLQFRVVLKKKFSKKALFSSLKSKKNDWNGILVKNETPANLLRVSISLEKAAWQIREQLKIKTRVIADAKERCLKLEIIDGNTNKSFKEYGKLVATSNEELFERDQSISDEAIIELIKKSKKIMETTE